MQKKLLYIFILCLISLNVFSQNTVENDSIKELNGKIISVTDNKPLQSAHILNLNSVVGATTNFEGLFTIPAKANDTLFISYVGFQSIKLKVTNDLLKGNELLISIHEKTVSIDEVTVKAHKLVGVLVVDAASVPMDKYNRILINGLPQAYEIGRPSADDYGGAVNAVFNPIDFWYNKIGKKPKELKKLKKLKQEDNLRDIMEEKFNREIIMEYMDMSRKDLSDLLKECNYSNRFIRKASDLQIIEAVLECYENYNALQKGKVQKDRIRVNKKDNE